MKYIPCLHVVLHQPEIPYNTGSVGRTCVAVGAKLWLVRPLGFRVDDYYLRRAGLDYWEQLEWEAVDDWNALEVRLDLPPQTSSLTPQTSSPKPQTYFFSKTAIREYTDVAYNEGDVLVFGCETSGLPPTMLAENANRALKISTRPEVRSLNLSNAAAIVLYEAVRQWGRIEKC